MTQADRTYTGHIRMRRYLQKFKFAAGSYRGNLLLVHLWFAFQGHLLPNPGVETERKEDMEERSTGAEASAAAGGAGAHSGEGAEGSSHSASAGAAPLPARQTTIAWPVVGGEGDRDLQITGRRDRTGQSALGLPSQPPGAATTSPGTGGPPGQAAAGAHDCEWVPRRILTSAVRGGPGPRGGSGPGGGVGTPGEDPGPVGGT